MNFIFNYAFILLSFLAISCGENRTDYFPLKYKKLWAYNIQIIPSEEDKINYKKTNFSLEKQIIERGKTKIDVYPVIRENQTVYYYSKNKDGIFREAVQFKQSKPVSLEEKKKTVLKFPLQVGNKWSAPSKTYLILRRYAYFDYRANTNFLLNLELTSNTATVKVPAGTFRNCLKVEGYGETTFIGDREIGSIKITIKTSDWYAPNVGLIKSVRVEGTDSDLFGTSEMIQELEDFK